MNATLFSTCPVPKCSNPVDDGQPCAECASLIAAGLIRPAGQPMTLDDVRRELAGQQLVKADRGEEYKANQQCWVCEQRRTCRPDPDQRGQWICKDCEAIQL